MKTKYGMGGCLSREQAESLPLADVWNRFHDLNVLYCGAGNKEEREMLEEVLTSRVAMMTDDTESPHVVGWMATCGRLQPGQDGKLALYLENRAAAYLFIAWLARKGGNP